SEQKLHKTWRDLPYACALAGDHIFMKTKFPSLAPLFTAALLVLAFVHPGEAADQVVTDLRDNGGPNQLRAKLTACLNSGGGTITFSIGGLVTVNPANGPLPTITVPSGISDTVDGV